MINRDDLQFEVCANSVESCLAAQEGGADRVELCAGIPEGGTTPSYAEILQARRLLNKCRLHVIIRPRGGDFCYTSLELERMAIDIDMARQLGVDGVVFGCLDNKGMVDVEACKTLLSHAEGLSCTFHRAFDRTPDPAEALETIIKLGFQRVLTSGQAPTADQGIGLLSQLQQQAAGRIDIMAGAGVNEQNIAQIRAVTGVRAFHFSAREPIAQQSLLNTHVHMGSDKEREDVLLRTTARRVSATIHAALV